MRVDSVWINPCPTYLYITAVKAVVWNNGTLLIWIKFLSIWGMLQTQKSTMKEFTEVAGSVTSFAGSVIFFCPTWISCLEAWFEAFWEILWNHFHPERVVSFKERAERGWKSGARSLSWKSGWKPCTLATTRSWIYPKTFFRFRERSNWKFP